MLDSAPTVKQNLANFIIITNNPLVVEKYPTVSQFFECTLAEIFVKGRDEIHAGARLINHPLYGSVKPNETPYRTLILSKRKADMDMFSLQLIEGAFDVLRKMPRKNIPYTERMLSDYQVIDLDIIDSAMRVLPPDYHF